MVSLVDRLAVGQTFDSLDEFEEVFQKYQEENYVAFSKSNGCRKLRGAKYTQETLDRLQYEEVRFKCKQGGEYKGYQGKGVRMFPDTLKVGCDAFISLRIHKGDDNQLCLRVKSRNMTHTNHEIGPEYALRYSQFRRFDITKEITEMILSPLVTNPFIIDYVKKTQGKTIHVVDLNNMRRKLKKNKEIVFTSRVAPMNRKTPQRRTIKNECEEEEEEEEEEVADCDVKSKENGEKMEVQGGSSDDGDKTVERKDSIENGHRTGGQEESSKDERKEINGGDGISFRRKTGVKSLRLLGDVEFARFVAPLVERGWTLSDKNDALQREFIFGNFNEAFRFITGVAMEGNKIHHYPEWYNCENKVDITLQTRSLGGLTSKDVRLAYYIESLTE